jgi:hypothetical protein
MRRLLSILVLLALARTAWAKPPMRLSLRGRIHAGRALQAFTGGLVLPNGLVYGQSVRALDLRGRTPSAIEMEVLARGFTKLNTVIRDPRTNRPITRPNGKTIPLIVYTHLDGGTVRVKPIGDPTNRLMPQPNAVKTLRWPYDAPGDGFRFEALKVDYDDRPLARRRVELRIQRNVNRKRFLDTWAHMAHTTILAP